MSSEILDPHFKQGGIQMKAQKDHLEVRNISMSK
jgi:hypothetical protein